MPASSLASSPAPIRVDPFLRARQILRFSTRAEVPWREMVTDDDKAAARELLSLAEENDGEDEVAAEEEQWPEKWSDSKRSLSSTLAHFRAVVRGAQAAQLGRQDQQRHDAPGDVGAGQEQGEDESNGASLNALDEADEDAVLQGDDEEGQDKRELLYQGSTLGEGLCTVVLLGIGPILALCAFRFMGIL